MALSWVRLASNRLRLLARLYSNGAPADEVVGFIGLGNMGAPMATNLLARGKRVIVYDRVSDPMNKLVDKGATAANGPAEVVRQSRVVVTMLPESSHVREVYTGEDGIFSAVQPGSLLVDSSTIDPDVSREMGRLAPQHQAAYIDAPVSGGVGAATKAGLTFMVGGTEESFERAKPILECMGKSVFHCGSCGTGQAAKICNNMLLAIGMIGTSEALHLAKNLGLDPKLCSQILNVSSGRCWSSEVYNPCPGVLDGVPSSNDYKGGFGTALMNKDLGLAQNAAVSTKTATPLGALALKVYNLMCQQGYGHKDFSSVFEFLKHNGL